MDLSPDPDDDLFTAGRVVPPGRYQRVDTAMSRIVVLTDTDRLPGSLDGRVALYRRITAPITLRRPMSSPPIGHSPVAPR